MNKIIIGLFVDTNENYRLQIIDNYMDQTGHGYAATRYLCVDSKGEAYKVWPSNIRKIYK